MQIENKTKIFKIVNEVEFEGLIILEVKGRAIQICDRKCFIFKEKDSVPAFNISDCETGHKICVGFTKKGAIEKATELVSSNTAKDAIKKAKYKLTKFKIEYPLNKL